MTPFVISLCVCVCVCEASRVHTQTRVHALVVIGNGEMQIRALTCEMFAQA